MPSTKDEMFKFQRWTWYISVPDSHRNKQEGSCSFIKVSLNGLESQDEALPYDNGKPSYLGEPWIWTWKHVNNFARKKFSKEKLAAEEPWMTEQSGCSGVGDWEDSKNCHARHCGSFYFIPERMGKFLKQVDWSHLLLSMSLKDLFSVLALKGSPVLPTPPSPQSSATTLLFPKHLATIHLEAGCLLLLPLACRV